MAKKAATTEQTTALATSVTPSTDAFISQMLPPKSARALWAGLPEHISSDVFKRNLYNALTSNPKLMSYQPALVFREVSKAAALGLLLDPLLGEAYMIEAYNYKSGNTEPQLRVGYKGMIKLARQSGNVAAVWAHEVHENDEVEADLGFPKRYSHRPALFTERGRIIGYTAVISYRDGGFDFEPMSLKDCLDIRDRSDAWKAFKADRIKSTPWQTDEREMCKKTVFRRLMKRQDQSPEMRMAQQIEDAAEFPHMINAAPVPAIRAPRPPAPPAEDAIDAPMSVESLIAHAVARYASITKTQVKKNPDIFEAIWNNEITPHIPADIFPPDMDRLQGIKSDAEKRLAP